MKTISSRKIKEIKAAMKAINFSLKVIAENEAIQEKSCNNRDYEAARIKVAEATADIMDSLSDAVNWATEIGCTCDLYEQNECNVIVKKKLF